MQPGSKKATTVEKDSLYQKGKQLSNCYEYGKKYPQKKKMKQNNYEVQLK